jgi:hypothetical protein
MIIVKNKICKVKLIKIMIYYFKMRKKIIIILKIGTKIPNINQEKNLINKIYKFYQVIWIQKIIIWMNNNIRKILKIRIPNYNNLINSYILTNRKTKNLMFKIYRKILLK